MVTNEAAAPGGSAPATEAIAAASEAGKADILSSSAVAAWVPAPPRAAPNAWADSRLIVESAAPRDWALSGVKALKACAAAGLPVPVSNAGGGGGGRAPGGGGTTGGGVTTVTGFGWTTGAGSGLELLPPPEFDAGLLPGFRRNVPVGTCPLSGAKAFPAQSVIPEMLAN